MTAKIQAGNVENSVHYVTCSFKGETTFKSNGSVDKRVCFFCLEPNHLIVEHGSRGVVFRRPKTLLLLSLYTLTLIKRRHIRLFRLVSLSPDSEFRPVTILRDTGATQSFISEKFCHTLILILLVRKY